MPTGFSPSVTSTLSMSYFSMSLIVSATLPSLPTKTGFGFMILLTSTSRDIFSPFSSPVLSLVLGVHIRTISLTVMMPTRFSLSFTTGSVRMLKFFMAVRAWVILSSSRTHCGACVMIVCISISARSISWVIPLSRSLLETMPTSFFPRDVMGRALKPEEINISAAIVMGAVLDSSGGVTMIWPTFVDSGRFLRRIRVS